MGKGRVKPVENRVLDQKARGSLNVPSGPVYYPTEEEFKDPLEYIHKIKAEAEVYGICKIVPPNNWKPPFGLDLESVKFPTKTQEIHRLQVRPASCNSKTFQLEYNRFLEEQLGKKLKKKKKVVFEGEELDFCKLFNAVKRFGGFDKVVKGKKWGEVYQFMSSGEKILKCAKHVLCQLYKEHLHDFENYQNRLNSDATKGCKRKIHGTERNRRCTKRRKRDADDEKNRKVENEEGVDQACEQCKSGKHGEVMLLCDSCNKGWHIYCLSPPLKHIPLGNWYCLECLNTDEETFGFVPGKCLSLEDFKRIADRAKRKWFGSGTVSRTQIEKKFWEIVEGSVGEVEVMYGNDLDTSVYGSGFPRLGDRRPESVEANVWDEYCGSPWNLNNLPKLKGSMLQAIRHNINGVTVPWLYLGMLFSSFCWHFEDHCFYSVNYLHWGEAKCWYGVPGSAATAFEKVMRKTLPDLFDAQPDLLFQLVTMLSPTVLQENKVSVYTVLQEPGNFVITFPKSFHAGFNFGLNCAEAVNFATADWLPYGGFGAELYRLYRKPAVISHDELLCVVAKENCYDGEGSIHLKKELLRIYSKEKTWREQLWKSGILRSSPMFLPECPDSVGIEEDPTCIICQQFLHLSAIVCDCRPSVFACLEHRKHLCECEPTKLRLVYRYTLAELHGMVQKVEMSGGCKTQETKNSQRPSSGTKRTVAFNKKEGMQVSKAQARPAEDWLLRASKVLDDVFSSVEYAALLKEAEQFLWGGSEMDRVRDIAKSLIEAKIWGDTVGDCLSNVEGGEANNNDSQKVHLDVIDELLRINPVPCFHMGHLKLKDYAEDARKLSEKIDSSLSTSPTINQLELLHSEVSDSPISLGKHEILSKKISSAKMLAERARSYLADTQPPGIELDALYKLKSEILELDVQLPETEGILDLLKKSESARDKCSKVLSGSISLENVEELLPEFDGFSVSIPELNILRQYHVEALSWISRFNDIMVDVHESKDQRKLISDLSSLLQDGASLGIQVEGLPLVEVELKKASCREKAQKVYTARRSLDFIEQLLSEAAALHIEEEKLFVEISGVLSTARCWEEKSSSILPSETQFYDLKDLVRMSVNIHAVLPSLKSIENTISSAESWLQKSKPFLSVASSPCSLLELPVLKDLVSQSKSLNIQLQEPMVLETLLLNCERWQRDNHQLLQETEDLLDNAKIDDGNGMHSTILPKITDLITRVDSARESGLSLGLNFDELPKLQTASLVLRWCCKTITLSSSSHSSELLEDVEKPSLQQIQQHLEEGETLKILPEEYYLGKRLVELKDNGLEWAKRARKVVTDSGALALEDVFELISEGENLPVHAEEELQSLRARSMLHCICLKPYNSRSMVSCSQCGEWYHTYCVKLHWRPKAYVCSACSPVAESDPQIDPINRSTEPETPSLNHRRSRTVVTDDLQWKNRKRVKRIAKRSPQVNILPWFFT